MPVIKILPNDVFYALSGLNSKKDYGPNGVPPIVLKTCASVLTPCLVKLFYLFFFFLSFFFSFFFFFFTSYPVPPVGIMVCPSPSWRRQFCLYWRELCLAHVAPRNSFLILEFGLMDGLLGTMWVVLGHSVVTEKPAGGSVGIRTDVVPAWWMLTQHATTQPSPTLLTSTFSYCSKDAFILPVPKKRDRWNPSNYRPIALHSSLSEAFESILNRRIHKHISTSDLLSDRQYGFRKGCSTGDLLYLLTDSGSFSQSFRLNFSFALDISKAFDRVWHKSLLSKLPSFGFYPSLCSFISIFLTGRSLSAVVDGNCSSPKLINSGVPQGSVLSPTLFCSLMIFIL